MSKDVEMYISGFEKDIQNKLEQIRKVLSKVLPDAEQGLKYGKPAYFMKRVLIVYAPYKKHIGFYPAPEVIEEFQNEIGQYKSAKGSVQFPLDQPLPLKLIEQMAKARYRNYIEKDAKWK